MDDEGSCGEVDEETSTTEATDSMFATNGVCVLWYFNFSTNYKIQVVKKSTMQHIAAWHWRSKDNDSTTPGISRKIMQKHFTPRTRRLVLTSQSQLRMHTALGDAFPSRAPEARHGFILNLLSTAAKENDHQVEDSEPSFTNTLQRVLGSKDTLEDVITFVCHSFNFYISYVMMWCSIFTDLVC